MSTRSHVRVYKNNDELAAFYHHYDGYLEGVGKEVILKSPIPNMSL